MQSSTVCDVEVTNMPTARTFHVITEQTSNVGYIYTY